MIPPLILLIVILGFGQPATTHCKVVDCAPTACEQPESCLIDTPEGEVCHHRGKTWDNNRSRYWQDDDLIVCPTTSIDPT